MEVPGKPASSLLSASCEALLFCLPVNMRVGLMAKGHPRLLEGRFECSKVQDSRGTARLFDDATVEFQDLTQADVAHQASL
jgi:hypothetical protein